MLAEEIDFYRLFRLNSTAMALLTADLAFIDANDAFLEDTSHKLDDVVGHNAFEILPKMPLDPGGLPKWTALEAALTSRHREVITLQRYDIPDPDHPGAYRERWWSSVVTPIRGVDGEVEYLELSAREVTPIIQHYERLKAQYKQTTFIVSESKS